MVLKEWVLTLPPMTGIEDPLQTATLSLSDKNLHMADIFGLSFFYTHQRDDTSLFPFYKYILKKQKTFTSVLMACSAEEKDNCVHRIICIFFSLQMIYMFLFLCFYQQVPTMHRYLHYIWHFKSFLNIKGRLCSCSYW